MRQFDNTQVYFTGHILFLKVPDMNISSLK